MSNLCFEPLIKALSDHVVNNEISKIRTSLNEETKDVTKDKPVIGEKRAWSKEMNGQGVKQLVTKCKNVEESLEKLKRNAELNDKKGVLFLDSGILTKMTENLHSVPGRISELGRDEVNAPFNEEKTRLLNEFKTVIDNEFKRSLEVMKNCVLTFFEKDETKQRVAILNDDIRDERQNLNKLEMGNDVLNEDLKRKMLMLDALKRERQEVVAINKSLTEQRQIAHGTRVEAEKKLMEVRESLAKVVEEQNEINQLLNSLTANKKEVEQSLENINSELQNCETVKSDIMRSLEGNKAEMDKNKKNDSVLQQLCASFTTFSTELQQLNKLNDLRTMYKDSTAKLTLCQSQCSQINDDIEDRCNRIDATTKNLNELRTDSEVKLDALHSLIEQKTNSYCDLTRECDEMRAEILRLLDEIKTLEEQALVHEEEVHESPVKIVQTSPVRLKIPIAKIVPPVPPKRNLSQGYAMDGNETIMTSDDDDDEDIFFETKTPVLSQVIPEPTTRNNFPKIIYNQDLNETVMTSDDDEDLFLEAPQGKPIFQNVPVLKNQIDLDDSLMNTDGEDDAFDISLLLERRKSKELPRRASNNNGYTKYFDLDESTVNFNSANFITSTPLSKKDSKRKPAAKKPPVVKKPPAVRKQPKKPAKKRN